jgi:hypothetical protein
VGYSPAAAEDPGDDAAAVATFRRVTGANDVAVRHAQPPESSARALVAYAFVFRDRVDPRRAATVFEKLSVYLPTNRLAPVKGEPGRYEVRDDERLASTVAHISNRVLLIITAGRLVDERLLVQSLTKSP